MINYLDQLVGRITNKLHELGQYHRTLVLFTTDNGTHRNIFSQHETGQIQGRKGFPVASGTHVSLIAYWPGTIQPGTTSDALIDFTDFLPTLMDVAGDLLPHDYTVDGLSFYDQLIGQADTTRDWIYCHYDPRWGQFESTRWAHDHTWKLYGNGKFFNCSKDPEELYALDDSTLDKRAYQSKAKLQSILDQMSLSPQTVPQE